MFGNEGMDRDPKATAAADRDPKATATAEGKGASSSCLFNTVQCFAEAPRQCSLDTLGAGSW